MSKSFSLLSSTIEREGKKSKKALILFWGICFFVLLAVFLSGAFVNSYQYSFQIAIFFVFAIINVLSNPTKKMKWFAQKGLTFIFDLVFATSVITLFVDIYDLLQTFEYDGWVVLLCLGIGFALFLLYLSQQYIKEFLLPQLFCESLYYLRKNINLYKKQKRLIKEIHQKYTFYPSWQLDIFVLCSGWQEEKGQILQK